MRTRLDACSDSAVVFLSFAELMRRSFIIFTSCHQPDDFSDEILFSFGSSMESTARISAISVSFFAPVKSREARDLRFLGPASIVAESDSLSSAGNGRRLDVLSGRFGYDRGLIEFQIST